MIQRVCNRHGKIGCECGMKKAWASSNRRKRLPRGWDRLRQQILRRDPVCRICNVNPSTVCDHRIPGDDHSPSNLQGICSDCDKAKSSAEGNAAGRRTPRVPIQGDGPSVLVALVGAAGVGKSTVGNALLRKGYRYRSIDDCGPPGAHRARWQALLFWLDGQAGQRVVVESNIIPPSLAERLRTRRSMVAELVTDEAQRRRQLEARGDWMAAVDVGHPVDVQVSNPGADAEIERALQRGVGHTPGG